MRQIARLVLALAILSIGTMAAPRPGSAFESCPALTCADYTYLCQEAWFGEPSFSCRGLCYDEYYYLWDYCTGNCTTGTPMECWGPPS